LKANIAVVSGPRASNGRSISLQELSVQRLRGCSRLTRNILAQGGLEIMTLKLKPLHPVFVAEATGLDLTMPISRADACEINAAMNRYGVLVWRGQPLTAQQQIQFATTFGPLDIGLKRVFKRPERLEDERLIDISNLALDGTVQRSDSPKNLSNFANQLWHSDSSALGNPDSTRPETALVHKIRVSAVRITPGPSGFDIRTFECAACDHIAI
jgi:hypothetical protein